MATFSRVGMLLVLLMGSAALATARKDKDQDKETPWDIISASPIHTVLTAALQASNLVGAVDKTGITVFAPNDEQVAELLAASTPGLQLTSPVVAAVLAHHVVTRSKLRGGSLKALNGIIYNKGSKDHPYLFDGKGEPFSVTPIKLTKKWSLYQPNRVIQPLNAYATLAAAVTALKLNTLTSLVVSNDLLGDLEDASTQKTVFGPTDKAFANIAGVVSKLTNEQIVSVLTYHVSPELYTVKFKFTPGVTTLLTGQTLTLKRPRAVIDTTGTPAFVIGKATNIYFPGGVLHGINKVLIPKLS